VSRAACRGALLRACRGATTTTSRMLDLLEATLLGRTDAAHDAVPLRRALADTGLAPGHALDLLTAFRLDVSKRRYRDWDELMHYCHYSAMWSLRARRARRGPMP